MKKLFAFLVVAALATSITFAAPPEPGNPGQGTGTVKVHVHWVNILVQNIQNLVELDMYPGSEALGQYFEWTTTGSPGIAYTITGEWTDDLDPTWFTVTDVGLVASTGTFGNTIVSGLAAYGNANPKFVFDVKCLPGTPRATYTGEYQVKVEYN